MQPGSNYAANLPENRARPFSLGYLSARFYESRLTNSFQGLSKKFESGARLNSAWRWQAPLKLVPVLPFGPPITEQLFRLNQTGKLAQAKIKTARKKIPRRS